MGSRALFRMTKHKRAACISVNGATDKTKDGEDSSRHNASIKREKRGESPALSDTAKLNL